MKNLIDLLKKNLFKVITITGILIIIVLLCVLVFGDKYSDEEIFDAASDFYTESNGVIEETSSLIAKVYSTYNTNGDGKEFRKDLSVADIELDYLGSEFEEEVDEEEILKGKEYKNCVKAVKAYVKEARNLLKDAEDEGVISLVMFSHLENYRIDAVESVNAFTDEYGLNVDNDIKDNMDALKDKLEGQELPSVNSDKLKESLDSDKVLDILKGGNSSSEDKEE